jgi:hypothetical protein
MLASSGRNVGLLLDEILDYAEENPESEPIVHRALTALREALADSATLTTLIAESLPIPLPDSDYVPRKRSQLPLSEDLNQFAVELQNLVGIQHSLQVKDLLKIADEVGPKYGKYLSQADRRAKAHILKWLRDNFELFYPSLATFCELNEVTVTD